MVSHRYGSIELRTYVSVSLGDVVYFDADGFYYVVDRLKDMIKVNGLQVSPSQLV